MIKSEEIDMDYISNVNETKTDQHPKGFILLAGEVENKEPYVLVIKGGLIDNNGNIKNKSIDIRISLNRPLYIEYDEIFYKDELEVFNSIMHSEWEYILSRYKFIDKNISCPDYTILKTMEEL